MQIFNDEKQLNEQFSMKISAINHNSLCLTAYLNGSHSILFLQIVRNINKICWLRVYSSLNHIFFALQEKIVKLPTATIYTFICM